MKKVIILVLAAVILPALFLVSKWKVKNMLAEDNVRTLTKGRFTVHYSGVCTWDAQAVVSQLESNFGRILQDLQVPDHPPVQVYIHPTREAFIKTVGFYSMGVIRGVDTLHLLKPSFLADLLFPLEGIAVHEFAHAVTLNGLLREATRRGRIENLADYLKLYEKDGKRFDQVYPRWLWESVAVYEANQRNRLVMNLTVKNGFPTLAQLNEHNNLVHNLGYSVVEYILHTHGKEKLLELMNQDGDTEQVLGLSEKEFEKEWAEYVRTQYWIFT